MRERVYIQRGKCSNLLLVAPHGADDSNTVILVKRAAELLHCHAVINQGFERGPTVDVLHDLADCNRIDHVKEPVVYDEFLKPIIDIRDSYLRKLSKGNPWAKLSLSQALLVCHVHGVGNAIHQQAQQQVAVVVGYGKGHTKDELSCQLWRKNLFVDSWRSCVSTTVGEIFEGKGGGQYAGRSSNNMNQYFRKHDDDDMVDSLQLEFPYSMRNTEAQAKTTGQTLAIVLKYVLNRNGYDKASVPKFI